jgi:hypothetical protein
MTLLTSAQREQLLANRITEGKIFRRILHGDICEPLADADVRNIIRRRALASGQPLGRLCSFPALGLRDRRQRDDIAGGKKTRAATAQPGEARSRRPEGSPLRRQGAGVGTPPRARPRESAPVFQTPHTMMVTVPYKWITAASSRLCWSVADDSRPLGVVG